VLTDGTLKVKVLVEVVEEVEHRHLAAELVLLL